MADKENYFTFKNKIFISYTKTIQTKTVDKLVDKILLYYNHEKTNKKNSKIVRASVMACPFVVYMVFIQNFLQYLDSICQTLNYFQK